MINRISSHINYEIRLRPVEESDVDTALVWYQNIRVLRCAFDAGINQPFDRETLYQLYEYYKSIGELYIIEIQDNKTWLPIGDALLTPKTLPLMIGIQELWGKGIGKEILRKIIQRAEELGYKKLFTKGISRVNLRSIKLFTSAGFKVYQKNKKEVKMVMEL